MRVWHSWRLLVFRSPRLRPRPCRLPVNFGEGGMAGIALALLALGGVALLSARRREDETVVVTEAWTDLS